MLTSSWKAVSLWAGISLAGMLGIPAGTCVGFQHPSEVDATAAGMDGVLCVYPQQVSLTTGRDFQRVVGQFTTADGITRDVTGELSIAVGNELVAAWRDNRVVPIGDGETVIAFTYQDHRLEVPVRVERAAEDPAVSFRNDVMPVFSKTGCNAGSCHGAARGKDGFRLSLYGFDPAGDYYRLTRELPGRRIDLALPDECLLVNKATGDVSHTGGNLVARGDEYYATLHRWLAAGAPDDAGPVPQVTQVRVFPLGGVLQGAGSAQQLVVTAHYDDGTTRDVTSLSYFMTSNDNSVTVSQTGLATAAERGQAFVMARFGAHTEGVPFIVLPRELDMAWPELPAANYVDQLINAHLKKLRIVPSDLCSDEQFIRRAYLDICGLVPSPDDVRRFLADPAPSKRAALVDSLLERKEFVELWVMKWSELLQVRSSQQVSYKATLLYYNWLQQKIADNTPIDQLVRELLAAEGGTFTNPATNYFQNEQDTLKVAENVAQVFLGTRIQCAQCHNHPFDRWTMNDYYQFAAFFSQIGRKASTDPRETIVFNRGGGETKHPVTGQDMRPKFLGGPEPDVRGRDRRAVLGEWLAHRDNEMFRKNLANIVWSHFFGRGIVHEVDDVRVSNPPANPELLDELGTRFADYNFDFKQLVRDLCNSYAYQRSTQTNASNAQDTTNFSHAAMRRIRAEVLLDIISEITETPNKFRGLPLGARAVQIADGTTTNYFLTTFGRAMRETVCSCEVRMEPNLSQALHLINGESVHRKIIEGQVIAKQLGEGLDPSSIIDDIYLRCLARLPTPQERQGLLAEVQAAPDVQTGLEDVFWATLNSQEFLFNH